MCTGFGSACAHATAEESSRGAAPKAEHGSAYPTSAHPMTPWGDTSLRSRRDIDRLFKEGDAYHGTHVVLVLRRVDHGPRQVLFVASRRVGCAVKRNRAKRLMREAYRHVVEPLPDEPVHLAWIARASCADVRMSEVQDSMRRLLSSANLVE